MRGLINKLLKTKLIIKNNVKSIDLIKRTNKSNSFGIVSKAYYHSNSKNNQVINYDNYLDKLSYINKDYIFDNDFKSWLSGFMAGDGSFHINKDGDHIISITLKVLDIELLNTIKKGLVQLNNNEDKNISVYSYPKTNLCHLRVTGIKLNLMLIVPLFKEYPIFTNKFYSFEQWAKSLENIYYNKDKTLTNKLIQDGNLNKGLVFSNTKIPFEKLNDQVLLGFIEAEGSFIIGLDSRSNSYNLEINICQKSLSEDFIKFISTYINNILKDTELLPIIKDYLSNKDQNKYKINLKRNSEIAIIRITLLDFLQYVVIPRLNKLDWHTTKYYNFKLFSIAANVIIRGLTHTEEGYKFISLLKGLINTNLLCINKEVFVEFDKLMALEPIYNLESSYKDNSTNYRLSKKNR